MKNDGLLTCNAIAICEMSKTSWQKGQLRVKDDLENHPKSQEYLLEQWFNIIRFQRETNQDIINLTRMYFFVSLLALS